MINLKLAEKFLIITLCFNLFFSFLLKSFNSDEQLSNLLVLFNLVLFVFLLIPVIIKNNNFKFLVISFLILRVLVLYLDYYGKNIANVLHSGGDSERFYEWGIVISKNLNMMKEISYTKYTDFLGILYWVIGDQRFFSQFVNVILGLWSIFVFYKILDLFKLKDSKKLFFLALYGFYPQNIIFSSILLREALIQFFFMYSILFFIRWFISNKRIHAFKTLLFIALSSFFHLGMILGLLVYGFIFVFLDVKNYKFNFTFKKIAFLTIFCGLSLAFIIYNSSLLTGKLAIFVIQENSSLIENYQSKSGIEEGGATYLRNFKVNSPIDLVLFMPLRLVYFIFSPMPYDVRGLGDLVAIFLDSSFYYFLVYMIVVSISFIKRNIFTIFPKIFLILFLTISLGFALGTENSGTAMRHRSKVFPVLLVAVIFIESIKQNKTFIWNDEKID
jgi:hypothetical protein